MVVQITHPDNPSTTLSIVAHWSDVPDCEPGIEIDPIHLQRLERFGASIDFVTEAVELADYSDEAITDEYGYIYQATTSFFHAHAA